MRWFGESWGAPVNDDVPHAPTPAGEPCLFCAKPILEDDQGYLVPGITDYEHPAHYDCMMDNLVGPGEWKQLLARIVTMQAEQDVAAPTREIRREAVLRYRRLLVEVSRNWAATASEYQPGDDIYPAATMASFYAHTLAGILGTAERMFGVHVAYALAVEAVEMLTDVPVADLAREAAEAEASAVPSGGEWWVGLAPAWSPYRGPTILTNVHPESACAGQHCVLHNPSDHHMRDWAAVFRADLHLMERQCRHGIGHPDPDDVAWHASQGRSRGIHSCDGCCRPPDKEET